MNCREIFSCNKQLFNVNSDCGGWGRYVPVLVKDEGSKWVSPPVPLKPVWDTRLHTITLDYDVHTVACCVKHVALRTLNHLVRYCSTLVQLLFIQ